MLYFFFLLLFLFCRNSASVKCSTGNHSHVEAFLLHFLSGVKPHANTCQRKVIVQMQIHSRLGEGDRLINMTWYCRQRRARLGRGSKMRWILQIDASARLINLSGIPVRYTCVQTRTQQQTSVYTSVRTGGPSPGRWRCNALFSFSFFFLSVEPRSS